jgi:uridine kinase
MRLKLADAMARWEGALTRYTHDATFHAHAIRPSTIRNCDTPGAPSSPRLVPPSSCGRDARGGDMHPLIVGIAGGSGSGKSTVARRIAASLDPSSVAFIDMDAYYRNFAHLSIDERRRVNWDHPEAFDWDLLIAHLEQLHAGQGIDKPVYDFVTQTRSDRTEHVSAAPVIVIDGILLFADPRVRDLCDVKVFVDAEADVRLIRRIRRDIAERGRSLDKILDQYLSTVQPMHLQFVEPTKRYADVIVPRGGHNEVAIEMLVAKIRRRIDGVAA